MPDVFGPFDGVTWSQAQWYRDAYARGLSGVFGSVFTSPGAGDLALTVAGLTASMGLGRAHVRGAGYERTGTAWSYATPPNTAAQPRIDRLVLRRHLAAQTLTPAVLQGTPAASPVPQQLTQIEDGVWELPLFRYTVPANSGAPLTGIVDERVPVETADSGWVDVTVAPGFAAASPAEQPQVRLRNGIVYLRGVWAPTGLAANANHTVGTVPAGFRPPINVLWSPGTSATAALGVAGVLANGGVQIRTSATLGAWYSLSGVSWPLS
jgi:hypothetical protein